MSKSNMPNDAWFREHPRNANMKIEIKAADDNSRVITGIASTGEVDRAGDIVSPDGATWKMPIPLLSQHDYGAVIGSVTSLRRTPQGISFVARIAKISEPATLRDRIDEAWALIRQRLLRTVSIGFRPTEWQPREGGRGGLVFTKFEILELSVVTVPANAGAIIETVAEAASLSAAEVVLRGEPAWMTEMLAPDRARFVAERIARGPTKGLPVVKLSAADMARVKR